MSHSQPGQAPPLSKPSPLALGLTHRSLNSLRESDLTHPRGLHTAPLELHIPVSRPSLSRSDSGWAQRPPRPPSTGTPRTTHWSPLLERTGWTGTEPSPSHSKQMVEAPRGQVRTAAAQSGGRQQPGVLCSHERPAPRERPVPSDCLTPTPATARPGAAQPCLWLPGSQGLGLLSSRSSFTHTRSVQSLGPAGAGGPMLHPTFRPSSHTAAGSSEPSREPGRNSPSKCKEVLQASVR